MVDKLFGKDGKAQESQLKDAVAPPRGLEVIEDDPETVWDMWNDAVAEQESRFGGLEDQLPPVATVLHVPTQQVYDFSAEKNFEDTRPMTLADRAPGQRKVDALQVVELYHKRIANTIKTLWGYPECSDYINKLIMAGGDGMGHARIGFNQEAVTAMMELVGLHEAEFGTGGGTSTGLHGGKNNLDPWRL